MKAKELVGKWIESDSVAEMLNMPAGTAFKVVGFVLNMDWALVDAGLNGWRWQALRPGDIVAEQCETYWLVYPRSITKVL